MTTLLIHILKWALCLAVLYIPFTLLLRKETFASLNRRMLLGIVAVSAMLPLFTVRFTIEKDIAAVISKDGKKMSGEMITNSMKPMHDRSNGLGGGFTAYGIYPEYKDFYALHMFFDSRTTRKD